MSVMKREGEAGDGGGELGRHQGNEVQTCPHPCGCPKDREGGWKWSLGVSCQAEVLEVAMVWVWPRD